MTNDQILDQALPYPPLRLGDDTVQTVIGTDGSRLGMIIHHAGLWYVLPDGRSDIPAPVDSHRHAVSVLAHLMDDVRLADAAMGKGERA